MKTNLTNVMKGVRTGLSKHSPEILTGIGIAGMITTTVLAVKATPKALSLLDDAKYADSKDGKPKDLTPTEVVKTAWKPYIPAAVTGVASIACLIGASSVNVKRNAALAAAYEISKTALTDYKEKVVEEIGEKKERVIREKVAQKKVDEKPVSSSEVIVTGNGRVMFLEPVSMRYFYSDIESIRSVVNDLNERMITGMQEYVSLSEFYNEIGLSHTSTSDDIGWNLYRDGQIKIEMPATTADNGEPCLMLDYNISPRYDYTKLMQIRKFYKRFNEKH